jgi:sigma-B regulation protein RsbU (phosphoserine phosphatase)
VTEEQALVAGEPVVDEGFYSALLEDDPEELYDNAPCAYLSALPNGMVVKANATFLSWTGYERAAVVGQKRFQDLLAPGDRIFYETHFAPLLRMQGFAREIAVELRPSDGVRVPVLINAVLKRDASGNPVLMRIAMFDATERRAYERELLAARRRAEESEVRAVELARTLQASFLPPALVSVPGLDVAGAYRPAGDGSEVGGDFYDVFQTGRGTWGVVLGDVCGKGAAAAVLTSLARYTVRAEALHTSSPSGVLAAVHEAFLRYQPGKYCTAAFVTVADGNRLTVTSAGHPLPLRRRPDGRFEPIGSTGTLLGMIDTPHLVDTSTVIDEGDVVVLYTDGVTEGRHAGRFFEETGLRAAVESAAGGTAQQIADAVVAAALAFQHGLARDDIAVVVIRR